MACAGEKHRAPAGTLPGHQRELVPSASNPVVIKLRFAFELSDLLINHFRFIK
jgi:hypothetical protein